jgi:DNA repair protein RadC
VDDQQGATSLADIGGNAAPSADLGLRIVPARAPRKLAPRHDVQDTTTLSDTALLTTLLGTRNGTACATLTRTYADLRALAAVHPLDLLEHGLTAAAVQRLQVIFEVARRYAETPWRVGESFRGSGDVYAHFREHLAAKVTEQFYAVLLDNKHRKLREVVVSQGSLTASIVHPRDVFVPVVKYSAAALIFVHNHPSGDPTPSKEDIEITRRLREVGDIVGVRVLDHVIVGKGRYVSFVDDGYW